MSENIVLIEEDVPGAKFRNHRVEEHSVLELKRWLECRGLKKTGNKKELVQRCVNCISSGRSGIIDVAIDEGKWYDLKLVSNAPTVVYDPVSTSADPSTSGSGFSLTAAGPSTSGSGFSTKTAGPSTSESFAAFPSVDIPIFFNKGHLYHYLIENAPSTSSKTSESTEKPFKRGQQYVDSEHVTDIYDCYKNQTYIVKCKIKASFRNTYYNVSVTLSKNSGAIVSGACECKAAALGRCSHVTALLLQILKHVEVKGYKSLTCTSKPCEWKKRSKIRRPAKIVEAEYPVMLNRSKRASFDPRAQEDKKKEATDEEVNNFLYNLDVAVCGDKKCYWQEILNYKYSDFQLDTEELKILNILCQNFLKNLIEFVEHKPQSTFQIQRTENQALSDDWFRWRNILVTSSKAHQFLGLKSPIAKMNFLKLNLWNLNKIYTVEMNYGIKNENIARCQYEINLKQNYNHAHITTTGLWMSKKYPVFACSPDGLVFRNDIRGILEIKCPKILENAHPVDFETELTKSQLSNFCLKKNENDIFLKKSHAYYTQVQMSMAITETSFCDFYIWSPKGTLLLQVDFDPEFWNSIYPQLEKRHKNLIVPEYFLMKSPRDLVPMELDN